MDLKGAELKRSLLLVLLTERDKERDGVVKDDKETGSGGSGARRYRHRQLRRAPPHRRHRRGPQPGLQTLRSLRQVQGQGLLPFIPKPNRKSSRLGSFLPFDRLSGLWDFRCSCRCSVSSRDRRMGTTWWSEGSPRRRLGKASRPPRWVSARLWVLSWIKRYRLWTSWSPPPLLSLLDALWHTLRALMVKNAAFMLHVSSFWYFSMVWRGFMLCFFVLVDLIICWVSIWVEFSVTSLMISL